MALQKEITLNNGIVTNYHTIQEVHYNFLENKTLIVLNSYVSKEIRDNHKKVDEVEQSILKLTNEAVKAEGKNDIDLLDSINEKINTLASDEHKKRFQKQEKAEVGKCEKAKFAPDLDDLENVI